MPPVCNEGNALLTGQRMRHDAGVHQGGLDTSVGTQGAHDAQTMIERYEVSERRQVNHTGSSHSVGSRFDVPPYSHVRALVVRALSYPRCAVACKMAFNDESAAVARSSGLSCNGTKLCGMEIKAFALSFEQMGLWIRGL